MVTYGPGVSEKKSFENVEDAYRQMMDDKAYLNPISFGSGELKICSHYFYNEIL